MSFSTHTLSNGMRVILTPLRQTKAVTSLVLVNVGSRNETARNNGISHFIEHMVFKGTKKRPRPLDISLDLEGIGAEYNAFTAKDYTGFYVKSAAEHLEKSIDVLADMLVNPLFKTSDLERERGVIIEEINMYEDNPRAMVDYELESLIYKGHPLARVIIGPKKVISSVDSSMLRAYKEQHYTPENTVVSLAGAVQPKKALAFLEKHFIGYHASTEISRTKSFSVSQNEPRVKIIEKKNEQVNLVLGFPSYADSDPKYAILKLLTALLGSGMSSRLFTEVREKRGLCYSIYAAAGSYHDTGDTIVKVGLEARNVPEALEVIVRELKKMVTTPVTAKELKKAKEYVTGKTILGLEDSEVHADWYAKEVLYNKPTISSPEQRLADLKRITPKQIQEVAKEIFSYPRASVALIGPVTQSFEKVVQEKLKKLR